MKQETKIKWGIFFGVIIIALAVLSYFGQKILSEQTTVKPSSTPIAAPSGNIVVSSPLPHEAVSQTFQVQGQAKATENALSLRVKHKVTGTVYLETSAPANTQAGDAMGAFVYEAQLTPDPSLRPGDELLLEVFHTSAKDSSEIDMVTIPLQFTPLIEEGN